MNKIFLLTIFLSMLTFGCTSEFFNETRTNEIKLATMSQMRESHITLTDGRNLTCVYLSGRPANLSCDWETISKEAQQ